MYKRSNLRCRKIVLHLVSSLYFSFSPLSLSLTDLLERKNERNERRKCAKSYQNHHYFSWPRPLRISIRTTNKKFAKYIFCAVQLLVCSLLFIEKRFNYVSCYSFSMFILKHLLQFQHLCVSLSFYFFLCWIFRFLLRFFRFPFFLPLFFITSILVSHSYSSMRSNFRTKTESDPKAARNST